MAKAKIVLTPGDAAADVAGEFRPDNNLTDDQKHAVYGTALPEEPTVTGEFPETETETETEAEAEAEAVDADVVPTVAEARVMFDDRPGLSQVLTVDGMLNRDGSFSGPPVAKRLNLDGRYVEVAE